MFKISGMYFIKIQEKIFYQIFKIIEFLSH